MEERLCRMPESKLLNQSINQSINQMANFANTIALILILSIVAKLKNKDHIFKRYCTVRREILFLQNMYMAK